MNLEGKMRTVTLCCVSLLLAACGASEAQGDGSSGDSAPADANMTDRFFSDFRPPPDLGPGCDSEHYQSYDDPRCANLPGCVQLPSVPCECVCVLCEWGKCIAVYCNDDCMVDTVPWPKDMAATQETGPADAGADSAQ